MGRKTLTLGKSALVWGANIASSHGRDHCTAKALVWFIIVRRGMMSFTIVGRHDNVVEVWREEEARCGEQKDDVNCGEKRKRKKKQPMLSLYSTLFSDQKIVG